mgnify:CR=1 FL=1
MNLVEIILGSANVALLGGIFYRMGGLQARLSVLENSLKFKLVGA